MEASAVMTQTEYDVLSTILNDYYCGTGAKMLLLYEQSEYSLAKDDHSVKRIRDTY